MALKELVSVPFLVSVVITCVLVAAVSFLFYNKIQQQSAKIDAIMDLTTTLVSEINSLKTTGNHGSGSGELYQPLDNSTLEEEFVGVKDNIHTVNIDVPFMTGAAEVLDPLIDVSEDENGESSDEFESNTESSDESDASAREDDEDDDDEDDDDDDEDDDDEDDDDDDDDDEDDDKDTRQNDIKIIKSIQDIDEDEEEETGIQVSNLSSLEEVSVDGSDDLGIDVSTLNFESFSSENDGIEGLTSVPDEELDINPESKVIEIGEQDITDYSKFTVTELRKVAFSRGMIGDNEKPNKNKLIKMLSA
jgi:hypothetical protein